MQRQKMLRLKKDLTQHKNPYQVGLKKDLTQHLLRLKKNLRNKIQVRLILV